MVEYSHFAPLYSPFPFNLRVSSNPDQGEEVKSNTNNDNDTEPWELIKKAFALIVLIIIKIYF